MREKIGLNSKQITKHNLTCNAYADRHVVIVSLNLR